MLVWVTFTVLYVTQVPLELVFGLLLLWSVLNWMLLRRSLNQEAARLQKAALEKQSSPSLPIPPIPAHLPRPLSQEEEEILNHCFPWSHFALHKVEYHLQTVICQGQLRSDPTVAYQRVQENIQQKFGDRFLVLFQENWQGKPFFALIPNPKGKLPSLPQQPLHRVGLAMGLLIATLLTTAFVGTEFAQSTPLTLATLVQRPELLVQGLPYAVALVLILGVHESGHFLAAQFYKVKTTLPYFIPFPAFLGTFGAFIQIRSPIPNRKALFDVSFAGPAAGLVITLPLLLWGLAHSELLVLGNQSSLMNFESLNVWRSALLALLSRLVLGHSLTAETALRLHPVAIAGCLGLIVTALNLMPVGQLDGGHIVHAMFGQRTGAIVGQVARLFMFLLSLVQPEFLFWALMLLFLPVVDEPALNDVSELNDQRDLLGFMCLGLLLLIIVPMPQALIRFLV
jgi:membrane-associated protease RseP (regulator of RpoE activity)